MNAPKCSRCQGEGLIYTPYEVYDFALEAWLNDAHEDPCPDCEGQGVTEILDTPWENAA